MKPTASGAKAGPNRDFDPAIPAASAEVGKPTSLTGFLLARIAEDDAEARLALRYKRPEDAAPDEDAEGLTWFAGGTYSDRSAVLVDPQRAVAECEAKRKIVELSTRHLRIVPECTCALCEATRLLALPYAGHPDYREEWKP